MRSAKYVGVFTADATLNLLTWDAWLAEATGLREEEVRGRSLLALFPEIEERGLLPRLQRVLQEGNVEVLAPAFHHFLIRCSAPGAQPHFDEMQQHVTISPLRDTHTIIGIVVTIEDVTARCVRERELAAQLKSQDEAIRIRAARLLSQDMGDTTPLLDAMDDSSWQVRQAAVQGVARHADHDVIARLAEVVRDHNEDLGLLNSALSALTQARIDPLPQLVPLLASEHANVRMYTALALGNLKDARAVPALTALLDDRDMNVRYHAIEALGRIRAPESALALMPILRMRDAFLSFAALDAIGQIGERSVAPVVVELLSDDTLAPSAVEALAAIGDEKAAAHLARLLDAAFVSAASVCRALSSIYRRFQDEYGEGALIGDVVRSEAAPEAPLRIIGAIPTANDDELVAIARVLGWLPFEGIEDSLAVLLHHPRARKIALESLAVRGPSAIAALQREATHDDPEVRKLAATGLGRIGMRAGRDALIRLLQDDVPEVVIAAASALGSIGDASAFDALVAVFSHDNPSVRHAAVAAINSIGHPDTVVRMTALLTSDDVNVRDSAARVAGYFGHPESLAALLELLSDPVESVQRTAVEHLGYFDDERVLPALVSTLQKAGPAVRAVAARALANVGDEAVESHLHRAISDSDPRVRYQVVQAVVEQRLVDFIPTLRNMARQDPATHVRLASMRALGALGDAGGVTLLVGFAKHHEDDIASAALNALGQIPGAQSAAAIESALLGSNPSHQRAALDSINETHLAALVPVLEQFVEQSAPGELTARAIHLLARSAKDRAVDTLVALAAVPPHREHVIAALSRAGDDKAMRIALGLRHPDPRVRSATVETLARMKKPIASRMLGGALVDGDPAVRFATEQALGRLDLITPDKRVR